MNQIEDDLDITVTVEKIATSVTLPDFGDSDDILLELFKQHLPKALIKLMLSLICWSTMTL